MRRQSESDVSRLALAMARLLADYWRRTHMAAVTPGMGRAHLDTRGNEAGPAMEDA